MNVLKRGSNLFLITGLLSLNIGCGSEPFTKVGELGSILIPLFESSTLSSRFHLDYGIEPTVYDQQRERLSLVFGRNDPDSATQIRTHLSQIDQLIDVINERYIDGSSYKDCTQELDATTLTVPFFDSSETSLFYESTTESSESTEETNDSFAFTFDCFVLRDSKGTTQALAFGKDRVESPSAFCYDPFEYRLLALLGPNAGSGHQIYKLRYHGCTKELELAIAALQSGDTLDGFAGTSALRAEIAGNVDTKTLRTRIARLFTTTDETASSAIQYDLIQAGGIIKVPQDEDTLILGTQSFCGEDTVCEDETALNATHCLKTRTQDGDYSFQTDPTVCAAHETIYEAITALPYAAIGQTLITPSAAEFGLESNSSD